MTRPWLLLVVRSSCLCFQSGGIEAFSFLPNRQGNGGDLARQCELCHLRLDARRHALLVELLQRSGENAGAHGRAFEDVLQIVIVVHVQSADEYLFAATFQLPFDLLVIGTAARFQPQTTVRPELALAAETMRGLYSCYQHRRADRAQVGNTAQSLADRVILAFPHQLLFGLPAQLLQKIQLLIEPFRATVNSRLLELLQPLRTMTLRIELLSAVSDGLAAIDRLQSAHHARGVFGQRLVA